MTLPDQDLAARLRIVRRLPGGSGASWVVEGDQLTGPHVLKMAPDDGLTMEAELLVSLRHPALPEIHEVGRTDRGQPWMLRAFVPGRPWDDWVDATAEQLHQAAVALLSVLAFAHSKGVLHLDLKPANVLWTPDGTAPVQVLDLGLGQRTAGDGSIQRGGTPWFASPEQRLGLAAGPRTDLYGLGATLLWVLLQKQSTPTAQSIRSWWRHFPQRSLWEISGVNPADLPAPFAMLLPRLLAVEPGARPADATAALELLGTGTGRPDTASLFPDPARVWAEPLARAAGLDPGTQLEIRGGAAADRSDAALLLAARTGGERRVLVQTDRVLLQPEGQPTQRAVLELHPMGGDLLTTHLQEQAGLGADAAAAAAAWLSSSGATSPHEVGTRLRALADIGVLAPDGAGWIWPEAAAGRFPTGDEPDAPPPEAAGGAGELVRRGQGAQALAAWRAGRHDESTDRAWRQAIGSGFLDLGQPAQALPLLFDLPLLQARALLALGRLEDASRALQRDHPGVGSDGEPEQAWQRRRLAAELAFAQGDTATAVGELESLAQELDDPRARSSVRIALGHALGRAGQMERARDLLVTELAAEGDTGGLPPALQAAAQVNLAHLQRQAGEPEAAVPLLETAEQTFRQLGRGRDAAVAALNLGVVQKDLEALPAARAALRRAAGMFRHLHDLATAAVADANLGIVDRKDGLLQDAIQRLRGAETQLEGLRAAGPLAQVRGHLAASLAEAGQQAAALEVLARLGHPPEDLRALVEQVRDACAGTDPEATIPAMDHGQPEPGDGEQAIPRHALRTLLAINRRLATTGDVQRAMDWLIESAVALVGARHGYLLLDAPDGVGGSHLELQCGDLDRDAVAFSRSLANRAVQEQRTLRAEDALSDRDLLQMPSVQRLEMRSALCVPFRSAHGHAGALYVEHGGRKGAFTDGDAEILEALADQAAIAVDRIRTEALLREELQATRRDVEVARRNRPAKPELMGKSPAMATLRKEIARLAPSDLPVLIQGETGSGKELVARALHLQSKRSRGPFVAENCSALPAELLERELFGHVRGAFTGADEDRSGLLELAHGGTLFLDEVGDMPLEMQARLLRALQEGVIRRLGATETTPVDLRILAASHKDIRGLINAGGFREDLYYRIAGSELRVPPLRERHGDPVLLAERFLRAHDEQHQTEHSLTDDARAALQAHHWPGNVRELQHLIARAAWTEEGALDANALGLDPDPAATAPPGDASATAPPADGAGVGSWSVLNLMEAERRTIQAALEATSGHKGRAAEVLGISRTALYAKLKRHGL